MNLQRMSKEQNVQNYNTENYNSKYLSCINIKVKGDTQRKKDCHNLIHFLHKV